MNGWLVLALAVGAIIAFCGVFTGFLLGLSARGEPDE